MNLKPNIAMIDDEYDLIDTYKELLGTKYNVTEFYDAESYLKYLEKFETNPFEISIPHTLFMLTFLVSSYLLFLCTANFAKLVRVWWRSGSDRGTEPRLTILR